MQPLLNSSAMRFLRIALLSACASLSAHAGELLPNSHRRPRAAQAPAPGRAARATHVSASITIRFERRTPKRRRCSTRGWRRPSASTTRRRSDRSSARPSSIPSAAMPHWGKAWALGPNYNLDIDDARAKAAYDALAKAQSLLVTRRRRRSGQDRCRARYVEALAARYSADPKADRAALARAFSQAMGDLSRRYPDDLDAAVIYAESLMNLTPWKLWTLGRHAGREHRAHRRRAGVGAAAQSESPRRESLTTFTPSRPRARRRARCRARSA